jgi:hypothetical protein
MKLIQIFAIAAALAVTASAQEQNSSSQKPDPSAQPKVVEKKSDAKKKSEKTAGAKDSKPSATTPIQVTVPKSGSAPAAKTGSAANKPVTAVKSSATAANAGTKSAKPAAAQKTGPAVSVVSQNTAKSATAKATQKVPVIAVTPEVKPQGKTGAAQKSATASKDTTKKQVAVAPAKTPFAPKVAQKGVAGSKPAGAQKKVEPKVVEAKSAAASAASATSGKDAPKPVAKLTGSGHRDPFISPVRNVTATPTGPNCSTGKKCLYIPELVVQGTVKDNQTGEMMAVVVNRARHTYFLRQNDQVFNGNVEKITSDSVIFREFATDNLGRENAHEVVKRVSPVS